MISWPDFEKKQILFFFPSKGDKLSFSNDNIVIKDADGKIKHQSTCYRLFALFVIGETSITSGLIQRAKKFGFCICLMNRSMRLYEILGAKMEGNTLLHEKQYAYTELEIGKHIISNKLDVQRAVLLRIRNRPDSTNEAIKKIAEYNYRLKKRELALPEILGLEGLSARLYFQELFLDYDWAGRKPRIKPDYINSTLDIGYTLLFNIIEALLKCYGFDTYKGVLHQTFYMRKSLVCDIVEPFRPIVDMQVRKSLNLGQFVISDFECYNGCYQLSWKMSSKYTGVITQGLLDYKKNLFDYIQKYYRCVMKGMPATQFPVFTV